MNDFLEEPDWSDEPEHEMEPQSPPRVQLGLKRQASEEAVSQPESKRMHENVKNGAALGDFLFSAASAAHETKVDKVVVMQVAPSHNITCNCNALAAEKTVKKDGPNFGKVFYSCDKEQTDTTKCNFFKWNDSVVAVNTNTKHNKPLEAVEIGPTSLVTAPKINTSIPGAKVVNCRCLNEAVQRTVQKEGPNKGKLFWTCNSKGCEFFEWCDKIGSGESGGGGRGSKPSYSSTRTLTESGGNGSGAARSGSCYRCGGSGHWANNCPSKK